MKKTVLGLIMTLGLSMQAANAADTTSSLILLQDINGVAEKIASQDWSGAEEELLATDFSQEDQVFAKINLAFLYSTTGRVEKAMSLYKEVLDGRDNSFAMTLSGKPRKVKYIAKDGLKMLESL